MTENKLPIAVCVMSGGMDSAVAAGIVQKQGYDLAFLHFNYGQITEPKEVECVDRLSTHFHPVATKRIDLSNAMIRGSSALFTGGSKEDGIHDKDEYVYFRNTILASFAVALAEEMKAKAIVFGSTGEDHICPDNSPEFWEGFQRLIALGTMRHKDITVLTPLTDTDKAGVLERGLKLGVPMKDTWSCHNRVDLACGECSNCRARLGAFESKGMTDPIPYVLK